MITENFTQVKEISFKLMLILDMISVMWSLCIFGYYCGKFSPYSIFIIILWFVHFNVVYFIQKIMAGIFER